MTGEVATIKRESFQTTEREEIENLRQIYGDKWYKEQLQVKIDYSQPPMNAGNGFIIDGEEFNFQFWFRDPPAGGANFNLSDGLEVLFCQ